MPTDHLSSDTKRERDRILTQAVSDIRKASTTMRADEALLAYMLRRLAEAYDQIWRVEHEGRIG